MTKRNKLTAVLLVIAILAVAAGSWLLDSRGAARRDKSMDGWEEHTVYWFDLFDTITRVVGYAPSQEEWTAEVKALHDDLLRYHKLYDIYNEYDGLTNMATVNRLAGSGPVEVDEDLYNMLSLAVQYCGVTGGKMNVAEGSMLSLWHECREAGKADPEHAVLPDEDALRAAAQHGSIDSLILKEDGQGHYTVEFSDPQLQLDVGSVGKGYAVEQAARKAAERGLSSAFISVGGNLRAIGHKPDGTDWSGGVEDSQNPSSSLLTVPVADGQSLVTSGDYQRYYTVDGVTYCHLIDPDTLYPDTYFHAVSILGPDSGACDALSTGLFCTPLADGQALINGLDGYEACWQLTDGTLAYSDGFEALSKK